MVLYNAQESCKRTSISQDDEGKANVENLFKKIIKVVHFGTKKTRFGNKIKQDNVKSRPLLLKFMDENCSREVLYNAIGLKYSTNNWMTKVGITVEFGKSELELDKRLRRELTRRESGDKSWFIRGANLIRKTGT